MSRNAIGSAAWAEMEDIRAVVATTKVNRDMAFPFLLPRPACGERVGVRGSLQKFGLWKFPLTRCTSCIDLSPQAGRGEPCAWSISCILRRFPARDAAEHAADGHTHARC